MARLNEILVGRFARGLQKLFGIKGEAPVAVLAPEVMPIHGLMNGVENRYLEGWDRFGFNFAVGGVAANLTAVRLRNPPTSGVIIVLEKLDCSTPAAQLLQLGKQTANTDLATVVSMPNRNLDARGRTSSSAVFSSDNSAAVVALAAAVGALSGNPNALYNLFQFEDQEIPILPGDAYQLTTGLVNSNLNGMIMWRERTLEESEKS
jgi:hypothetical protein